MWKSAHLALIIPGLCLGLCSATSGLAFAQDADGLAGQALVSDEMLKEMASGDRKELVAGTISAMKGTLDRAKAVQEKTRKEERDVLKLNCVNEKIAAMKGFVKVGENAETSLHSAIAKGDQAGELHQTRLVMIAGTRVQVLGEETETCAGELVQYHGATTNTYETDENMRTDNPTDVETADVSTTPLPDASPFQ